MASKPKWNETNVDICATNAKKQSVIVCIVANVTNDPNESCACLCRAPEVSSQTLHARSHLPVPLSQTIELSEPKIINVIVAHAFELWPPPTRKQTHFSLAKVARTLQLCYVACAKMGTFNFVRWA